MSAFKERTVFPRALATADVAGQGGSGVSRKAGERVVVTDDATGFTCTQTTSTFTMTPTRVDTATAGSATGAITADATDSVMATNIQAGIRALGGIYANATVVVVGTDQWVITVFGGYDITWASTATGAAFQETAGAYGSGASAPGSVLYQKELGIGKFGRVFKIILKGFNDNSLDIDIKDKDGKSVFVATAIDTSTASADAPFVKLLGAAGVAGEDGAAATAMPAVFRGALLVKITTSAPAAARAISPRCTLVVEDENSEKAGKRFLERTSGARTTLTGTIGLGSDIAVIRRISLKASADTTVAPTLTDADGLVVYTKTSSDFTTEVNEALTHDGVNQANGAVVDLLPVVAKSPLTISGSGLGSGTFTIKCIVEV